VAFPDLQLGWYPAAVAGGTKLLRERSFDLIFSSAFPITSHLIARTLKRRSSLPWVAEWRDPWSDDPDFRLVAAPALKLERSMAAEADAVVLPNETFAEYYAQRWGVQAAVVGHGSDAPFNGAAPRPDPPVLAHVGSYYPGRQSLETLWSALAEMRRRGDAVPRLRWVGAYPDEARAELARHGLEDIVDLTGFVSHPEALSMMSAASGLIACDFVDTRPLSLDFVRTVTGVVVVFTVAVSVVPGCRSCTDSSLPSIWNFLVSGTWNVFKSPVESLTKRSLPSTCTTSPFTCEVLTVALPFILCVVVCCAGAATVAAKSSDAQNVAHKVIEYSDFGNMLILLFLSR
jgi:glycosyltransferase involved in cell wall biosynthesis